MPVESFQPLDTGSMYVGTLETRVRDYILNVDLTQIGEGGTVNFINNDPDNYITLDGGFDNDFMFLMRSIYTWTTIMMMAFIPHPVNGN